MGGTDVVFQAFNCGIFLQWDHPSDMVNEQTPAYLNNMKPFRADLTGIQLEGQSSLIEASQLYNNSE